MVSRGRKNPKIDLRIAGDLYRIMYKIRRAEERIAHIYPTDKIQSPIHLSIGQEAVSAGICRALKMTDHIYGTYRGHGIYIGKGGDLKRLFAELYAKDSGCARGRGGSMHLIATEVGLMGCSAIVASTIPLAVGDALAAKMRGERRISVAFFGDGAMGEGLFFESLNFALLKKLPVIFVCENNNYAVHSRVQDRHRQTQLYRFGEGLGVPGRRFDGRDAMLVYQTMSRAIREVRNGGKPLLLEYMTYRLYEHVGPGQDHQERYRDKALLRKAVRQDSLHIARRQLVRKYKVPEKALCGWEQEINNEVEEAVDFAEKSPFPSAETLCAGLYKEKGT